MTLVARAASRTKPCDENGDGYRDTLIWLTILELARQSDELIGFVSNNTHDFAELNENNGYPLHPHLVQEQAAAGVPDRVTLFRKLEDLVMDLAKKNSPTAPTDLREVGKEVERAIVVDYITTQVVPSLAGQTISPSRCGLPLYVASASIEVCDTPEDIEIIATNPKGAESLGTFSFSALVSIGADLVGSADVDGEANNRTTEEITKTLRFLGVLTRDQFERPTSAEVTEIAALTGDPGLALWASSGQGGWPSQTGVAATYARAFQTVLDAQKIMGTGAAQPAWMQAVENAQKIIGTGAAQPAWMQAVENAQKIMGTGAAQPAWMQAVENAQKIMGTGAAQPAWVQVIASLQRAIESQNEQLGGAPPNRGIEDADNEERNEAETDPKGHDQDEDDD